MPIALHNNKLFFMVDNKARATTDTIHLVATSLLNQHGEALVYAWLVIWGNDNIQ